MEATLGVYTSEQVIRLTGISRRKLAYWLEAGVVSADIEKAKGRGRVRLYSFRNLVEIRTAVHLRGLVSFQVLRKVVPRLRDLFALGQPSAQVTLRVLATGNVREPYQVVVLGPDGIWEEGASGQRILEIELPILMFADALEAAVIEDLRARRRPGVVERRRGALGSTPVFAGTRVPTSAIRSLHEAGWSDERILANYPGLTPEDIEVVLVSERSSRRSA